MSLQTAQAGSFPCARRSDALAEAQHHTAYLIAGRSCPRVPHAGGEVCGDCGARPGQLHVAGCEFETCPVCGERVIACDCAYGGRRSRPPRSLAAS